MWAQNKCSWAHNAPKFMKWERRHHVQMPLICQFVWAKAWKPENCFPTLYAEIIYGKRRKTDGEKGKIWQVQNEASPRSRRIFDIDSESGQHAESVSSSWEPPQLPLLATRMNATQTTQYNNTLMFALWVWPRGMWPIFTCSDIRSCQVYVLENSPFVRAVLAQSSI